MLDRSEIAPKPHSFLAVFRPKEQSAQSSRSAPPLDFQTTIDTAEYAATISYSEREMLTLSADGQCLLVLAGIIYRPQSADIGAELLDLYERHGLDFLKDLNGEFSLLLIDQRTNLIALATDRLHSNKVLVSWDGGTLTASNSIYLQPLRGARVDRNAVASYLTISYVYYDRTLFEGIRVLESGSVYRLADGRLEQHKYWRFIYAAPTTARLESLKKDLSDLLVEATRRRAANDRPIYLSLTGGTDSAPILGILAKTLRIPDVRCFTYTYGEPLPNSDEAVAPRLAALVGYEHRVLPSFDGDVVQTIQRNAHLGGSMTRPCDEVDLWLRLGAEVADGPRPVLFAGDTLFLEPQWTYTTHADRLAAARMRDFSVLSWLEPYIGSATYQEFLAATRADIELAVKRVPYVDDGTNFRDMLRIDQIQGRVTGTYREYYAGRFFRIANPLLDGDVIDFMLRLPTELRYDKTLYRETVQTLFPQLFAFKRASSASYATYWPKMLRQQKTALETLIRGQSSPLDDIIDPEILLTLLAAERAPLTRSNARLGTALKHLYRLFRRVGLHRSTLGRPSRYTPALNADQFLKRALTLRAFLAETANSK